MYPKTLKVVIATGIKPGRITTASEYQNMEIETIIKAQGGDCEAIAQIVGELYKPTKKFIHKKVSCYEDAEELTQDIFVHVWKSIPSIRQPQYFSTWFNNLRRNLLASYYRRTSPEYVSLDSVDKTTYTESDIEFLDMIRSLDSEEQCLLTRVFVLGESFAEIARDTNRAREAVRSKYRRTIRKLRRRYEVPL